MQARTRRRWDRVWIASAALVAGVRPHVTDPDEADDACGGDFFVEAVPHETVRDDVDAITPRPGLAPAGRGSKPTG